MIDTLRLPGASQCGAGRSGRDLELVGLRTVAASRYEPELVEFRLIVGVRRQRWSHALLSGRGRRAAANGSSGSMAPEVGGVAEHTDRGRAWRKVHTSKIKVLIMLRRF